MEDELEEGSSSGTPPGGVGHWCKGNWKCSECGTAITELPFEPSGDRPVFCRECYRARRPPRRSFRR